MSDHNTTPLLLGHIQLVIRTARRLGTLVLRTARRLGTLVIRTARRLGTLVIRTARRLGTLCTAQEEKRIFK